MVKYVAWAVGDDCRGWTSKENFEKNIKNVKNIEDLVDENETIVEFDGPEYDSTDKMFNELGRLADKACFRAFHTK